MWKRVNRIVMVAALVTGMALAGCNAEKERTEVTVLAASSLSDALKEAQTAFGAEHPDIRLVFSFASSGKLRQQIEQGAPADLFFSADPIEMKRLEKQGMLDRNHRRDLLSNELVLIIPKRAKGKIRGFRDLNKVDQLAIGQPETVPAGRYAKQTLQSMGLWRNVESRIIYAKDVRQVLTYVETGNVDAGIVYRTDAAVSERVIVAAVSQKDAHQPIIYPAAVLTQAAHPREARVFYRWLQGDQAQSIFQKYGFKGVAASNRP